MYPGRDVLAAVADAPILMQLTVTQEMLPMTADLFDTKEHWLQDPSVAFDAWIANQSFGDASMRVYRAMVRKFLRHLASQSVPLHQCTAVEIGQFLDRIDEDRKKRKNEKNLPTQTAASHHRYRYIRLLERVFARLIDVGVILQNPATTAALRGMARGRNAPKQFLSPADRDCLTSFVEDRINEMREMIEKERTEGIDWRSVRDLALVSIMIGGGVRVMEAVGLTVNCMNEGCDVVSIRSFKAVPMHAVSLISPAPEALRIWLRFRQTLHLKGDAPRLLFPADRSIRGLGARGFAAEMSAASIFRRVQGVLASCGIDGERAGPQLLRNTYAGTLFEEGWDEGAMMETLGYIDPESLMHLRADWNAFCRRKSRPAASAPPAAADL